MDHQKWLKNTFIKGSKIELLLFIQLEFTQPTKFEQLSELLGNIFYSEKNRNDILDVFCSIQRTANAISRLKYIYRFNRSRIYNTEDLYMNPISIQSRNTITLLQNDTKYIFHIRELIHTMNSCLSHCCHFFADPIICKNPYTNLPFTKSALYNIYFAIKGSSFLMPTLFHRYFLSSFNYETFFIENGELVNEEYLKTYVENYCLDNVYSHVKDMYFEHHMKFYIHKSFPRDVLFETMKPYLKLYFTSNFSMNINKKRVTSCFLRKKLYAFVKFNPNFGKRKVKLIPINPFSHMKKCSYFFDQNTISFVTSKDSKTEQIGFMKSHLDDCDEKVDNSSSSSSSEEEEEEEEYAFETIVNNRTPTPILHESEEEQEEEEEEEEVHMNRLPIIEDSDSD